MNPLPHVTDEGLTGVCPSNRSSGPLESVRQLYSLGGEEETRASPKLPQSAGASPHWFEYRQEVTHGLFRAWPSSQYSAQAPRWQVRS